MAERHGRRRRTPGPHPTRTGKPGEPAPLVTIAILGTVAASTPRLHRQVMEGLSYAPLDRLRKALRLSVDEAAALLQIPLRTLSRRKASGRLLPVESDRLVRTSLLYAKALELFEGDRDAARDWFMAPEAALGGASPFEFAKSEVGSREVERVIGRLEHGAVL